MRDQPRALAVVDSSAFADGVCIVTGASAGIGAALCEALACELKVSVVAVARRADPPAAEEAPGRKTLRSGGTVHTSLLQSNRPKRSQ